MNKLSAKIILLLIVTMIITSVLPRIFIMIFGVANFSNIVRTNEFFLGMIITTGFALLLFSSLINVLIIKRLRKISIATKMIARSEYEIELNEKGHDEISLLTKHFKDMALTLKSNEYLHKNFVRNFSHELKTPISSIKGYADLIVAQNVSVDVEKYALVISAEADRLSRLSKSMLQLSEIDSTTIVKTDDTYNVAEQIRNVLQLLQREWESKEIEFDLDLHDTECNLNKDWLFLLWQNLISNAIRFSSQSGNIQVSLRHSADIVQFEITDHGVGIEEKDKENIFKLFFVADRSRKSQSSGLGLSICKMIVEKLHGEISFQSVANEHTTFKVVLPLDE